MTTVLLAAHGSPGRMDDFLRRIMKREPPPALVVEMEERYRKIGGSPLLEITRRQATALSLALGMPVDVGMLYSEPFLKPADVVIAATPFGGRYAADKYGATVPAWYGEPQLVRAWTAAITDVLEDHTLLFTAHSVPVECGPYADQVRALMDAILELLGDVPHALAWQSRSPAPGAWLEPDVDTVLGTLRGRVLVAPIGFISDHVETLYDLDIATAERLGPRYERVRMLNDAPMLIEAMAEAVRKTL